LDRVSSSARGDRAARRFFTDPSRVAWDRLPLRIVLWGTLMSTIDVPADFASEAAEEQVEAQSASNQWAETALTIVFTATAVMFVSFVAVITGLV
jgi:hypothetical protein